MDISNRFDLLAVGNVAIERVYKINQIPSIDGTGLILSEKTYLGGRAGNIALTVSALGLSVAVAALVGADFEESGFIEFLVKNHVDISRIQIDSETRSPQSVIFYTEKGKILRFFEPIHSSLITLDLPKADFENCHILYITAFNGEEPIRKIVETSKDAVATVVLAIGEEVNRKNAEYLLNLLAFGNYLFLNQIELEILLNKIGLSTVQSLLDKNRQLESIAVTRGNAGSILYSRRAIFKIPAVPPTRIVNTLGAGDAYVAGFIYGLRKGFELEKCGKIAAVSSSFVLETENAQPLDLTAQALKRRYGATFLQDDDALF